MTLERHRTLTLTEHQTTAGVQLSAAEASWLNHHVQGLEVRPGWGKAGTYDLRTVSYVGTAALPRLTVFIRPKVPAERVLFLISYALGLIKWQDQSSSLAEQPDLTEGVAALYGVALRNALAQGILQGYRSRQEALNSVRGRIRFDEQLRRRFMVPIPLEVEYDDFTIDTDLNRLLFAALRRLKQLRIRSAAVNAMLAGCTSAFMSGVSRVEFTPRTLPEFEWNRLNQHYRPATELALAILASSSVELEHGNRAASSFMINMDKVFEQFVRRALRDALHLPQMAWPDAPSDHLDLGRQVTIKPDLIWLEDGAVVFVGDAKYKRLDTGSASNADLYQLNAYATAFGLPAGLLIHAEGSQPETVDTVRNSGTHLITRTLDISGQPAEVLESVRQLALRIRELRTAASHPNQHAASYTA